MDRTSAPGPSLDGLRLPLDKGHIEAAATYRDNKDAEGTVCCSIGLQVGDYIELRDNLVRVLVELGVQTATISNAFAISGREVWEIVAADPISLFGCLGCGYPLPVRGLSDVKRLLRALDAARKSRPGDRSSADLFCGVCTEVILERLNEQGRRDRRASEARIFELNRMPYAEYLLTPEWRNRRAMALAWAGHRCQVCDTNDEELHVHHRVYTRRGRERPEDLIVLCRTHHALVHGLEREAS